VVVTTLTTRSESRHRDLIDGVDLTQNSSSLQMRAVVAHATMQAWIF